MFRASAEALAQPPRNLSPHVTFDCDPIGTPDLASSALAIYRGGHLQASSSSLLFDFIYPHVAYTALPNKWHTTTSLDRRAERTVERRAQNGPPPATTLWGRERALERGVAHRFFARRARFAPATFRSPMTTTMALGTHEVSTVSFAQLLQAISAHQACTNIEDQDRISSFATSHCLVQHYTVIVAHLRPTSYRTLLALLVYFKMAPIRHSAGCPHRSGLCGRLCCGLSDK